MAPPRTQNRDVSKRDDSMSQGLPGVILGVGALVLCLALRAAGAFEGLELSMHDHFLRAELPVVQDESPVVAVAIGEDEFARYGYPIPNEVLATAPGIRRCRGRHRSLSGRSGRHGRGRRARLGFAPRHSR